MEFTSGDLDATQRRDGSIPQDIGVPAPSFVPAALELVPVMSSSVPRSSTRGGSYSNFISVNRSLLATKLPPALRGGAPSSTRPHPKHVARTLVRTPVEHKDYPPRPDLESL